MPLWTIKLTDKDPNTGNSLIVTADKSPHLWNLAFHPHTIMEEADFQLCLDIKHHAARRQTEAPMTPTASTNEHEEGSEMTNDEASRETAGQRHVLLIEEISDDDDCQLMPPPPKKVKSDAQIDIDCLMSDEAARERAERFLEQLQMPAPLSSSSPPNPFATPPSRARPPSRHSSGAAAISTSLLKEHRGWEPPIAGRRHRSQRAEFQIYEDPSKPGNTDSTPEGLATAWYSSSSPSDDEKENMVERGVNEGDEQTTAATTTRDNTTRSVAETTRVVRTNPRASSVSPTTFDPRTAFPLRELRVPGPSDFGNPSQHSPRNHHHHRDDDLQEVFGRAGEVQTDEEEQPQGEHPNRLFSARRRTSSGNNNGGERTIARNVMEGPRPRATIPSSPPPLLSAGGGGPVRPAVSLPRLNNGNTTERDNNNDTAGTATGTRAGALTHNTRSHRRNSNGNSNGNGRRDGYRSDNRSHGHSDHGSYGTYRGDNSSENRNYHRARNLDTYRGGDYRGENRGSSYRGRYMYGRGPPLHLRITRASAGDEDSFY
ncbi:hypothetical protein VTN77DRAFT_2432 [Rasamsonia byssochlamydoides]|uniref:uncharacterized protein n=1 Tax=Rasamsonia byssochlamydoides TaxID=89139 RepID=UPI0037438CFF